MLDFLTEFLTFRTVYLLLALGVGIMVGSLTPNVEGPGLIAGATIILAGHLVPAVRDRMYADEDDDDRDEGDFHDDDEATGQWRLVRVTVDDGVPTTVQPLE